VLKGLLSFNVTDIFNLVYFSPLYVGLILLLCNNDWERKAKSNAWANQDGHLGNLFSRSWREYHWHVSGIAGPRITYSSLLIFSPSSFLPQWCLKTLNHLVWSQFADDGNCILGFVVHPHGILNGSPLARLGVPKVFMAAGRGNLLSGAFERNLRLWSQLRFLAGETNWRLTYRHHCRALM